MNRLPTTDLYFLNSCGDQVARIGRRGPIRALGDNTFQCGDTILLVRRDSPELMHRALQRSHRLIYLVDDDIAGALHSPGLPEDYRRRLATFDRDFHQGLIDRADHLVVASNVLGDLFSHKAVTVLDPCWALPMADLAHFRGVGTNAPIKLAHLGTASHAAGLSLLEPVLLHLLARADLAFTFIAQTGAHPALEAHPRARRIDPQRWPRYRRWLARQRFHLGLYPLTDTPFDRARSANKLIEHGIVGAVGVYPESWAPAHRLGSGAILAPAAPGAWFDAILAALDDPNALRKKVGEGARRLPGVNNPTKQRAIWSELLGFAK